MSERISLSAQIDALHNVVLSRQAWIRQAELAETKGHTRYELTTTRMWQPDLEAALETLRWVQANEADVRAFVAERKGRVTA